MKWAGAIPWRPSLYEISIMRCHSITHKRLLLFIFSVLPLLSMATDKVRVACVGNSITYGYGIADREHDSYPAQLQALLGEGYEVGNFGRSGATLLYRGHRPYVEMPEFRQAMDFRGDIVVMHLGINDTDPRDWPNYGDDFVRDYGALIDSFRVANPKARIVIARLSPISNRHHRFQSGTRDWLDSIQHLIPIIAARSGVELIDFHTPLYRRPDLFPDGLHPNPEGAGIMADVVYRHITGQQGGLTLSPLYTDHAVLQHAVPLCIQGHANAGEKVTVKVAGRKATTHAAADGHWEVTLDPLKAGGPYTLSVSAPSGEVVCHDVMAGEVWLCSGQSNMEFMLKNADEYRRALAEKGEDAIGAEVRHPQHPLRLYNLRAAYPTDNVEWDSVALRRVNDLQYLAPTTWTDCTPTTVPSFSAVAYYFGRMLQDSLQVPVGLITNAVGGTNAESWIDRSTLEHELPNILTDWLNNDFIQDWCRGRAARNISLALESPHFPHASTGESLQRHPYQPCYMFESGILPLDRYPIRGVIWYQGESNAHNIETHVKLFPLLVDSWRRYWDSPSMPFLFVQLSSLSRPSWPSFRDSQRRLADQLPNVGMAVCTDVGDSLDVHPRRKQPVGERLARRALADVYATPFFVHHASAAGGPSFISFEPDREGHSLVVRFESAEGLTTSDGQSPATFEVADAYGVFYPAEARIDGETVVVSSPEVKRPTAVRYGWQPFTRANLVNAYGLPASTFTSK